MNVRKSPQQKKQNEYDRDFRPLMENPHAFRKNWPKKKARANRRERAAIRSHVIDNISDISVSELKGIRRLLPKIIKDGILTLRERIKHNVERRQLVDAPNHAASECLRSGLNDDLLHSQ